MSNDFVCFWKSIHAFKKHTSFVWIYSQLQIHTMLYVGYSVGRSCWIWHTHSAFLEWIMECWKICLISIVFDLILWNFLETQLKDIIVDNIFKKEVMWTCNFATNSDFVCFTIHSKGNLSLWGVTWNSSNWPIRCQNSNLWHHCDWQNSFFCRPHTQREQKTNASMIFTRSAAFYACVHTQTAPDEPRLFWF